MWMLRYEQTWWERCHLCLFLVVLGFVFHYDLCIRVSWMNYMRSFMRVATKVWINDIWYLMPIGSRIFFDIQSMSESVVSFCIKIWFLWLRKLITKHLNSLEKLHSSFILGSGNHIFNVIMVTVMILVSLILQLDVAAPKLAELNEPIVIAKINADKYRKLATKYDIEYVLIASLTPSS